MITPTISVLVPCYNAAPFLRDMIESVVVQTWTDWELTIVDDGSTDNSVNVVESALRDHSDREISLLVQPHRGCSSALKDAVDYSHGRFCTFVGADDFLPSNSLHDIVEAFDNHPEVGFLWTRYLAQRPTHTSWKEGRSKSLPVNNTLKKALLSGWWGALAQDCWRREAYLRTPGLDPTLSFAVDQQIAMLFANLECDVMHLPVVTYYHIQHDKQMSATHYKEQQRCRGEILRRMGGQYVRER